MSDTNHDKADMPMPKKKKHWVVSMTLIETTGVEAETKEEAIQIAQKEGFMGTTQHVKTTAKLAKK